MRTDRFDLTARTRSSEALAAYVDGLDLMLSGNEGGDYLLRQAIAADPQFALPVIALARFLQLNSQPAEALRMAVQARALAATASKREAGHVEAVALAIEGKAGDAMAAIEAHLQDYPRDGLVLSLALGVYGLIAFGGRNDHHEIQRRLLDRLAPQWGEDWWFLGYWGWAHAETGEPKQALPIIERSLKINARFAHAVHARTHAHYELGHADEAADFLRGWLPRYASGSILHCHLNWHLALFDLMAGRADDADQRYKNAIRPSVSKAAPMPTLADAASYLWRRQIYDPTRRDLPWAEIDDLARRHFATTTQAFGDLHAAMTQAACGDFAGVEKRAAELEAKLAAGKLPQGRLIPDLCRALGAFAAGEDAKAIELLDRSMPELKRVAGSHAQREIFEDTLILACLRAGKAPRARQLLEARLKRRPRPLDRAWLKKAG